MSADGPSITATPPVQLSPALASKIAAGLARTGVSVTPVARGDVYRLVGGVDDLASVIGKPDLFRGFKLRADGGIEGHGEFAKLGTTALAPAVAISVTSAALGCYWQQQVDTQLSMINEKLDVLIRTKEDEKDADLSVANEQIEMLTARFRVGDRPSHIPASVERARSILFQQHHLLERQVTQMHRWKRTIPLHQANTLSRDLLPEATRFHRALVVDTQMAKLELLHAESLAAEDFRDRVLRHADKRREMLRDLRAVLGPLAHARLQDDTIGIGEHTVPSLRKSNLRSRREIAHMTRPHLHRAFDIIADGQAMIPDTSWWHRPFLMELSSTSMGDATATASLLDR